MDRPTKPQGETSNDTINDASGSTDADAPTMARHWPATTSTTSDPTWPTWTGKTARDETNEDAALALTRGQALGRYVILSRLGAGAMGVVYAAYDPELDRKVAIKLLHTRSRDNDGSQGRLRLLREAQALAQLSHPNVVAVHDVGAIQDGVFIAMEFIAGRTLQVWLREEPRTQEEILTAFRSAGAGLAAAHAAGIIHRDFKPQNVLVGNDERIRVLDFGLARKSAQIADIDASPETKRVVDHTPALDVAMTQTGEFLGTPRYMSPEQFEGREVTATTDQFSFCVALYEALYSQRPFEGDNLLDLALAVREGRVRDAPKKSGVPVRLHRALLKGLSVAPEARHPSMDLLLFEIRSHPVRSHSIGLIATAVAVVAGLVLIGQYAMSPSDPVCSGAEQKLAGIWDEPRKHAVQDALLSTNRAFAKDAWSHVESALDTYANKWIALHIDACKATRVRGDQSEQALDLKMACFERRRKEIQALTDVIVKNPNDTAERAVQAASSLGDLRLCTDTDALSKAVPPPTGKDTQQGVDELSSRLSQIKAMSDAGRYDDAFTEATGALASARALGYRPAEAEALFYVGQLQDALGDAKAAEDSLVEAVAAALAGHDDGWFARAAVDLVWICGSRLRHFDDGRRWATIAEAAIERLGGDDALAGRLTSHEGSLFMQQQKYDRARPLFERSLEQRRRAFGPEHLAVAQSLMNLGNLDYIEESLLKARERHTEALGLVERLVGSDHPQVSEVLGRLGADEIALDHHKEAMTLLERALSIQAKTVGDKHPLSASIQAQIGKIHLRRGNGQQALEAFERAKTIQQDVGMTADEAAAIDLGVAQALAATGGDPKRARQLAESARDVFKSADRQKELAEAEALLAAPRH